VRIARVLVDSPLPQLDRLLDYRIPELVEGVEPGQRVSVPLRSAGRLATGFVVEITQQREYPGPLSDVAAVVSPVRVLAPEVWNLARAVADRAAGSANDVLRLAVPKRQARVEKTWLAREADAAVAPFEAPTVTDYAPAELETALADRRRIALGVRPGVTRTENGQWVGRWARTLGQLAARTLATGESAIIVVPDHRDQEQLAAVLAELVPPEALVRADARQSDPERYRGLLRALEPAPAVIVGSRSAIYAPASKLGLIAVWNDGDPLLGEPLAPYIHARDAALVRQEQQRCALVLAGHTRSTEVQRLVEVGWLGEIAPERPRHPRVVPTANMAANDGLAAQARIPSFAWKQARAALEEGPVLVQVARPGYAPGLRCQDCGTAARCRSCAGPLRERSAGAVPSCTWCGALETSWRCPNCESTRLRRSGVGAGRTADELGRAFPGVRIIIADGERTVLEVDERPTLVIATRGAEPIAAGGYRAVLLLDGERMIARESLRVAEDCARWWADAAALAADDGVVVLVGVGGALASAMVTWRFDTLASAELSDRRDLRFPPAVRMATLDGFPDVVAAAVAELPPTVDVLGVTEHDGRSRALLRFDYAAGAAAAQAVRAEIIRHATRRRKPVPGSPRRGRQPLPLRARFDDPEPFEE
tara:strand:- start:118949 stop:120901 length:1953 start_codon:yes stop_codon:yes gene_type:complete